MDHIHSEILDEAISETPTSDISRGATSPITHAAIKPPEYRQQDMDYVDHCSSTHKPDHQPQASPTQVLITPPLKTINQLNIPVVPRK